MPLPLRRLSLILALLILGAPVVRGDGAEPASDEMPGLHDGDALGKKRPPAEPEPVLPLIAAVAANDEKAVRKLLGEGADPNQTDKAGRTALHHAAYQGRTAIIGVLLAAKAELLKTDAEGATAAHLAADGGQLEALKALVEAGTAIETPGQFGQSLLHTAAALGRADCTAWLLERGADVGNRSKYQSTPLHQAACTKSVETVNLLLAAGADVAALDHEGRTPLHNAATNRDTGTLKALLAKGADAKVKDVNGMTALDLAFGYGTPEAAKLLFEAGARIGRPDQAFYGAVTGRNLEGVRFLIDQGFDVKTNDALITASRGLNEDISLLVLKHAGAPARDSEAIHNAALQGHARFIAALLDAGVDVDALNGHKLTPLFHAARQGHADAVELLLARGAAVEPDTESGSTPLHAAALGPIDHRPACGPAPNWEAETPQYVRVIAALVKAGAGPDKADTGGRTPKKMVEDNGNEDFRRRALEAMAGK